MLEIDVAQQEARSPSFARRRRWHRRWLRARRAFKRASLPIRLYALSLLMLAVPVGVVLPMLPWLAAALSLAALFIESWGVLLRTWSHPWRKSVATLLGAIALAIAHIGARQLINDFTHVEPTRFAVSLPLITAMLVVVVWWSLLMVTLAGASIALFCYQSAAFAFKLLVRPVLRVARRHWLVRLLIPYRRHNYAPLTWRSATARIITVSGRALAVVSLLGLLASPVALIENDQGTTVRRLVASLIVVSNYVPQSDECPANREGEWLIPLGNGQASVATPDEEGGFTFRTVTC